MNNALRGQVADSVEAVAAEHGAPTVVAACMAAELALANEWDATSHHPARPSKALLGLQATLELGAPPSLGSERCEGACQPAETVGGIGSFLDVPLEPFLLESLSRAGALR